MHKKYFEDNISVGDLVVPLSPYIEETNRIYTVHSMTLGKYHRNNIYRCIHPDIVGEYTFFDEEICRYIRQEVF